METSGKIASSLQGDINRLRRVCKNLSKSNLDRKRQITKFDTLIKKLLGEGRITKEELSQFMSKRK